MANQKVTNIYNLLSQNGLTKAKDVNEFSNWMAGSNYRQNIYGLLKQAGVKGIGSGYGEFTQLTGYGKRAPSTSTQQAKDVGSGYFGTTENAQGNVPSSIARQDNYTRPGSLVEQLDKRDKEAEQAITRPLRETAKKVRDNKFTPQKVQYVDDKGKVVEEDEVYPVIPKETAEDMLNRMGYERMQAANKVDLNGEIARADANATEAYRKAERQNEGLKPSIWQSALHDLADASHVGPIQTKDAYQMAVENDPEYKNRVAALNLLKEADYVQKAAEQSKKTTGVGGWFKDAAWGMKENAKKKSTWDNGETTLATFQPLYAAAEKYDRGEQLTDSERELLRSAAIFTAYNDKFGGDVGSGVKAGQITDEAVQFMVEMGINPASGLGKALQKKFVGKGMVKLVENMAESVAKKQGRKAAMKEFGKGMLARVGGDLLGGAVMAGTSGLQGVAGDTYQRMQGQSQYGVDLNGDIQYSGRGEDRETNPLVAAAKAFGARTIENHSEMVGAYFGPALGVAGKFVEKGLRNMKLGGVVDFIKSIGATKGAKLVDNFFEKTKWDGTIGEYAEEVVGGIENALVVGDQTLDRDPETGVFNGEQNLETFLSVALMGGFMSTLHTGTGAWSYAKGKQQLNRAEYLASESLGDKWGGIKQILDKSTDADASKNLNQILSDNSLSAEQKAAVREYAKRKETMRGVLYGEEARKKERAQEKAVTRPSNIDVADDGQTVVQTNQNGEVIGEEKFDDEEEAKAHVDMLKMQRAEQDFQEDLAMAIESSEQRRQAVENGTPDDFPLSEEMETRVRAMAMNQIIPEGVEEGSPEYEAFVRNMDTPGTAENDILQEMMDKFDPLEDTYETVAVLEDSDREEIDKAIKTDPVKRTERQQKLVSEVAWRLHMYNFPKGELHPEQSFTDGQTQADLDGAGTEYAMPENMVHAREDMEEAQAALDDAMAQNSELAGYVNETINANEPMSPEDIVAGMVGRFSDEERKTVCDFINAQSRLQGYLDFTDKKMRQFVTRETSKRAFKGTLNGAQQGNMVMVSDGEHTYFLVGGDVSTDENGRIIGDGGKGIVVVDEEGNIVPMGADASLTVMPGQTYDEYSAGLLQQMQVKTTAEMGYQAQQPTEQPSPNPSEEGNAEAQPQPTDNGAQPAAEAGQEQTGADKTAGAAPVEVKTGKTPFIGTTSIDDVAWGSTKRKNRGKLNAKEKDGVITFDIDGHKQSIKIDGKDWVPSEEVVVDGQVRKVGLTTEDLEDYGIDENAEFTVQRIFKSDRDGKWYAEGYFLNGKSKMEGQTDAVVELSPDFDINKALQSHRERTNKLYDDYYEKKGGAETKPASEIPTKDGVKLYEQGVPLKDAIEDIQKDGLDPVRFADLAINEAQTELSKMKEPKTRADLVKNNERQKELQNIIDYYTSMKEMMAEEEKPTEEPADTGAETEPTGEAPEWRYDKPEDARRRGYKVVEGHRIERQEEKPMPEGMEVEVQYSTKDKVKGRLTVSELDDVQGSHLTNGQRNEKHFLPEAQPKAEFGADRQTAAKTNASEANFRPELMLTFNGTQSAYSGSTSQTNRRGEIIQGNGRRNLAEYIYAPGNEAVARKYKDFLKAHAEELGTTAEAIEQMEKPFAHIVLDVTDAEAIRLGQFTAQDLESGGKKVPEVSTVTTKLGGRYSNLANIILSHEDPDASLSERIEANAETAVKWLNNAGIINNTEAKTLLEDKSLARQFLKDVITDQLFKDAHPDLRTMFYELPKNIQSAIISVVGREVAISEDMSILKDIQESIRAYHELITSSPEFAGATGANFEKRYAAVTAAVNDWLRQINMDGTVNSEKFSNFAIELAKRYKSLKDQKTLANLLRSYYDKATGATRELGMFEDNSQEPKTKEELIKQIFGIDYGRQRTVPLAGDNRGSEEGGEGSTDNPQSDEREPEGTGPADNRGGDTGNGEEVEDLDDPEGIGSRISEDGETVEEPSANGTVYKQDYLIDGKHKVTKVDEPDSKRNYTGSYYMFDGKRYGDLNEIVREIDSRAEGKPSDTGAESNEEYLASHPLTEEQIMADTEATEDEKLNAIDFLKGEDDSAISRFYYDSIYNRAQKTSSSERRQKKEENNTPREKKEEETPKQPQGKWSYNFHYDKETGRAWITRDDWTAGIPIEDGRFRIEGRSLAELRGILENPRNNMGEVLQAVEARLHNAEALEELRKQNDPLQAMERAANAFREEQKAKDQQDIDNALDEFNKFLDDAKGSNVLDAFMHKGLEGNDKAQANLLDAFTLTNEAQRMFLKDLLRLASKVGYAYIKKGVHDAQAWSKQMSDSIGKKLKEVLGWDDAIIGEFVDEVWNQKYTADGQRMRMSEHAERLKNNKGADTAVNVNKKENNVSDNSLSSQQEAAKPQLEGDSAEFAERQKKEKALRDDLKLELLHGVSGERTLKTMQDVKKLAEKHGLSMSMTDLQEIVEAVIVDMARNYANNSFLTDRQKFNNIVALYQTQPTLSARDNDRINKQQYSTPAPMAFLMGQFVAATKSQQTMNGLEPSAGNGMLTINLPKEGMHVNDIDEMRLSNLQKQGFGEVTNQDGTQSFGEKQYDVIVTNPPFGNVTPKVYDGLYEISGLEHQMAINALESMKDDGRAAIIIGGNTEYNANGTIKGKDRVFLNYLYAHYNVVDVINMDGKTLYSRQGTGFPVRMILINGRKEFNPQSFAPVQSKARAEQVKSYDELFNRVNDDILRDENKPAGVHDTESGTSGRVDGSANAGNATQTGVRGVRTEGSQEQPAGRPSDRPSVQRSDNTTEQGSNGRTDEAVGGGVPNDGSRTSAAKTSGRTTQKTDGQRDLFGGGNDAERLPSSADDSQRVGQRGAGTAQSDNGPVEPAGKPAGTAAETEQKPEVKRGLGTEKVPYRKQSSNPFTLQSLMPAEQADVVKKALEELGDVDQILVNELGYSSKEELHQALAAEQIDSVAMAIHQMNQGSAFIIGDQTGIGKGRQAAALIRYGVKKGGCPVFITVKKALFSDMYRDLCDIGSPELRPFIWSADDSQHSGNVTDKDGNVVYQMPSKKEQERVVAYINKNGKLPPEYDYVLTTYDSFKSGTMDYEGGQKKARQFPRGKRPSAVHHNGQAKRDALETLAGNSYVIMDESHNAGGEGSNVGYYLQYITTRAKGITFLSATFAKRPGNMPIYSLKTAISKAGVAVNELIDAVKRGGATFQEIMSKALTEAGQMIRRERDMTGVTIDWRGIEDEAVIQKQREQYDKVIGLFNDIINFQRTYVDPIVDNLNDKEAEVQGSVEHTPGTRDMGINNTPFASRTYNMVQQILLSLKAEEAAKRAIEHLKAGHKPVITVANTNEGAADEVAAADGESMAMPDLSVNLKKGLRGTLRITRKDAFGNTQNEEIPFDRLSPAGQARYAEIMEAIENASTGLSLSPIDVIKNELKKAGYKVGELTGRQAEFVYNADGTVKRVRRTDTDKKKVAADFNNGKLDALILNRSAGTGISLHASSKFKDQHQRVMIVAQAQGDVNDEVQIRGRIDRTGQVLRGMYEYVVSQIPSEQRLLMMLKSKLRSLDANTTSSQKSKFNEMDVQDIINKYGDQIVIQYLAEHPDFAEKMQNPLKWQGDWQVEPSESLIASAQKAEGDGATASKVLGRMALLTVKEQEQMLDEIGELYQAEIDRLDEMGENDLEITEMPLKAKTISKEVWETGIEPGGNNPFADNTYMETVQMDVLKKPMKGDEVKAAQERLLGSAAAKNWEDFKKATMEKVNEWAEQKKKETTEAVTERAKKKATAEQEKYIKGAKKSQEKNGMTDAEIERNGKTQYDHFYKEEMDKLDKSLAAIEAQRQVFEYALDTFSTDGVYAIPSNIYDLGGITFEPGMGKLIDVKISDNFSPNASTLTFATLDGRRKITVPINGRVKQQNDEKRELFPVMTTLTAQARHGMFGQNVANTLKVLEQNLDNWDKLTSSAARKEGHIITGNLLKALVSTREQSLGGKLISYTTDTGEVRQGILMPDSFDASKLTSKQPISSAKDQLGYKNDKVESVDGEVQIRVTNDWDWKDGGYNTLELTVPKSKKKGEKYFNDKVLLSLMDGQFEGSGKMKAEFPRANLDAVMKRLDEMGVTVKEERKDSGTRLREIANNSQSSLRNNLESEVSESESVPLSERPLRTFTDYNGNVHEGLEEELQSLISKERGGKRGTAEGTGEASEAAAARSSAGVVERYTRVLELRREIKRREGIRDELRREYNIDEKGNISLEDVARMFRDMNTNKTLGELFDKVYAVLKTISPNFRFTDNFKQGEAGAALMEFTFYDWDNFVRRDNGYLANVLLHEMIHNVTSHILRCYENPSYGSLTREQKRIAKEITELYEYVKKEDPRWQNGKKPYGLDNAHDMVAELSNPDFRKLLDSVTYKGTTVLQRLKALIREIFGLKNDTALDRLSRAADRLIDSFDENMAYEYRRMRREIESSVKAINPNIDYVDFIERYGLDWGDAKVVEEANARRKSDGNGGTRLREGSAATKAQPAEKMKGHLTKLAKKIGTKVVFHDDASTITNAKVKEALQKGKRVAGWFDPKDNSVHFYMPNIKDRYEAEKTIWHEVVGHKGMRALLGEEGYRTFMRRLWMDKSEDFREMHQWVTENFMRYGGDLYETMDEWFAYNVVEPSVPKTMWDKVMQVLSDVLRRLGFMNTPNMKDMKYMLWLSKNAIKEGDAWTELQRNAILAKLDLETRRNARTALDGTRARDGFSNTPTGMTEREMYKNGLMRKMFAWTEAHQDYMASAKLLMDAILKGRSVLDKFNFYWLENHADSKIKKAEDVYVRDYCKPMEEAIKKCIAAIGGKLSDAYEIVEDYMAMKHGLERNREFFVRDWLEDKRKKTPTVEDLDEEAESEYERAARGIEDAFEDGQIETEEERDSELRKALQDTYLAMLDRIESGFAAAKQQPTDNLAEWLKGLDDFIREHIDEEYNPNEHDYSGLTSFGNMIAEHQTSEKPEKGYDDDGVIGYVMDMEGKMGKENVDELWKQKRRMTQFALDIEHEAGLITDKNYEKVSQMFHWYMPLRKWDEDMAEDIWSYMNSKKSTYVGNTLMKARGRKSRAEMPIGTMFAMGGNAIVRATRNEVKKSFAGFVRKYEKPGEDALVTELDAWVENIGTEENPDWVYSFPDIPEGASQDDIIQAKAEWAQHMLDLMQEGRAKRVKQGDSIPYRFENKKRSRPEHIVEVYEDGRPHFFIVNDNPRAAQAINGKLKPETKHKLTAKVNRFMSSVFTSYSPTFMARNAFRDAEFASSMLSVKEGWDYCQKFMKNYVKVTHFVGKRPLMFTLFRKYRNGTLDDSNKMERYFKEFAENGGITGYVMENNAERWEKEILAGVKEIGENKVVGITKNIVKRFMEGVEHAGEAIENAARFATYVTSREEGRTITKSVNDAKEVSVNFNRKGAGYKTESLLNEKGEKTASAVWAAKTAQYMRANTLFYNASLQGIVNSVGNAVRKPWWFAAKFAIPPMVMGALIPVFNAWVHAMLDDDDDKVSKDPYADLPEYTRRMNMCIYIGHGKFVMIPLSIEHRAFFGLGDIMAGQTYDERLKSVDYPFAVDAVRQLTAFSPVDYNSKETGVEGVTGWGVGIITPAPISPLVNAYFNKSWTGSQIQRENAYGGSNLPEYQKAKDYTNKTLVGASRMWHEMWGGDEAVRAGRNQDNKVIEWFGEVSPAKMEYVVEQYFGEPGKLGTGVSDMFSMMFGDKEADLRKIPIVKAFVTLPNDNTQFRRANTKYWRYRDEFKEVEQDDRQYRARIETNPDLKLEYENKFKKTKRYKQWKLYNPGKGGEGFKYKKTIEDLQKRINAEDDPVQKKGLTQEKNAYVQELVELLDGVE